MQSPIHLNQDEAVVLDPGSLTFDGYTNPLDPVVLRAIGYTL